SPGSHQHHLDDLILHTVVADLPQGRIAVEFDATDNERRVYRFGMTLMLLWLIVSATGFWLARRIARLVIGPMVDVTDRIATWIPGAGSIQVDRDDEAGHLVEAFNRVQDQVDRSIAREREFTANLSHETRTPLTIIRTDAELLALSPGLDARQRERVRRIVTTIDDIAATIESARETRDDQPVRRETIALKRCVDDAWNGLEERAATRGLSLINEVPDRTYIEADRAGLLIVLRNLVRNAIDHAAPATLRVRSIAGGLEIADDGAGIAAEDLPFVFERYYRGRLSDTNTARDDGERGLGLAIAKRVCELRGWALTVRSSTQSPDRGTQFELVLKPSESLHQDVASMPG
ncbi:MAG: HAMP domain-containing histidine kinase, partial [Burkholderiales bacterium]|nr:HAMP domain-containing histidine kinase [Burkholderiales bacterium]